MAEFALRVTSEIVRKEKYDEIQPLGAVISGWSDRRIRRKWVEIVCDIFRPAVTYKGKKLPSKREKAIAGFMANCGWTAARCQAIADLWSEALWLRWMDTEQPSTDQDTAKGQLWDGDIASASGWISAVGKEPNGLEDVVNTVPWSLDNLRSLFMVPASGLAANEAEAVAGKRVDVVDLRGVITPFHVIDWDGDLGLTEGEKAEIRDPSAILYPRFDKKIQRGKIKEFRPDVPALRGLGR